MMKTKFEIFTCFAFTHTSFCLRMLSGPSPDPLSVDNANILAHMKLPPQAGTAPDFEKILQGVPAYHHHWDFESNLHVPTDFEMVWNKLYERDQQEHELKNQILDKSVKLVLAVFSIERDAEHQEVIRNTWWKQRGLCLAADGPKQDCSVYTAFVHGNESNSRSPDVLKVNIKENMNKGKSHTWFQYAATNFPWATHIGKMDVDTYPYLKQLVTSLAQHHGTCETYIGKPVVWKRCFFGGGGAWCPPPRCGKPLSQNFLHYSGGDECWSYMQGGLYIMSQHLAAEVTTPGTDWSKHKEGFEDLVTGRGIASYARSKNVCVDTWDPQAWYHHGE